MFSSLASKIVPGSGGEVDYAAAAKGADAHIGAMKQRQRVPQGSAEQLATAKKYMDARLANNAQAALAVMSPNIVLTSQRDGSFKGLAEVESYLRKTPPEGEWSKPYLDQATGLVKFDGRIKFAKVVPISVKSFFLFGADGKVEEIFVGKA